MGRRKATGPSLGQDDLPEAGFGFRTPPVHGARIAWSYVAALVAMLLVGLGVAISDTVQSGYCGDSDVTCTLGVFMAGTMLAGLVGASVVALLFRLGWEWLLIVAAAIVSMPALLDLMGSVGAWVVLALSPGIAAAATWNGPDRTPRRPVIIGAVCAAVIAWAVLTTFVLPIG